MGWKLDVTAKVFQIFAVIWGALWVYFNALRGRTFVPRLQVEVSGKFFSQESARYLLVTMQVKNVGSSRVRIHQKGTGLKINRLRRNDDESKLEFLRVATQVLPVLRRYTVNNESELRVQSIVTIEPGSAHMEQKLITIPEDQFPHLELELRVVAHRQSWWIPKWVFKEKFKKLEKLIPESWKDRSWSAIAIPVETKDQANTSTKES